MEEAQQILTLERIRLLKVIHVPHIAALNEAVLQQREPVRLRLPRIDVLEETAYGPPPIYLFFDKSGLVEAEVASATRYVAPGGAGSQFQTCLYPNEQIYRPQFLFTGKGNLRLITLDHIEQEPNLLLQALNELKHQYEWHVHPADWRNAA